MKHRVAELEGALLDAAVALAEGRLVTEADEHPQQPGYYRKLREEWGDHIVRWYARSGENADGPETDEEGGWEPMRAWGSPSTEWNDGGPIIERERIALTPFRMDSGAIVWRADVCDERGIESERGYFEVPVGDSTARTPLIAAMRAYVASKLGDEVELP